MHGDAQRAALRQRASPAGLGGHQVQHVPHPRGLDGIERLVLAVVPVLHAERGQVHLARRPDQLLEKHLRVLLRRARELVGKRAHRKRMRDVRHGPVPAHAHVRGRRRGLDLHVGHVPRDVGGAQLHLEAGACARVGPEQRHDRRERRSVEPRGHLARGVEPAFHVLRGDGVVVAVMDLVVARPDHLHRRADLLRQQRRLDDEVGLGLAAEPAADERHVQRDLRQVDPKRARPLPCAPSAGPATAPRSRTRRPSRLPAPPAAPSSRAPGAGRSSRRSRAWPPIPAPLSTSPWARMAVPLRLRRRFKFRAIGGRVV